MGIFNLANLGILAWLALVGYGLWSIFTWYGWMLLVGAVVWLVLYAMVAITRQGKKAGRR